MGSSLKGMIWGLGCSTCAYLKLGELYTHVPATWADEYHLYTHMPAMWADEYHLYYNVGSFVWKGLQLERQLGSVRFGALVLELLVMSQALIITSAYLLAEFIPAYRWVWCKDVRHFEVRRHH